jgi:hypothetical protein
MQGKAMSAQMKLPDYPDWVIPENRIGGDDGPALFQALRDQHAIEWVAVMQLQALHAQHVFKLDWEHADAVGSHF